MNCKEKLLEVRDLHKVYTKEGVPTKALNGITFNVLISIMSYGKQITRGSSVYDFTVMGDERLVDEYLSNEKMNSYVTALNRMETGTMKHPVSGEMKSLVDWSGLREQVVLNLPPDVQDPVVQGAVSYEFGSHQPAALILLGFIDTIGAAPHLLPVSSYNRLLEAAGEEPATIRNDEAIFYLNPDFTGNTQDEMFSIMAARLHQLSWNMGEAPLLFVVTPTELKIFNNYKTPQNVDGSLNPNAGLIDTISLITDLETQRQKLQPYNRSLLESGEYWRRCKERFDVGTRIDTTLMNNLKAMRRKLINMIKLKKEIQKEPPCSNLTRTMSSLDPQYHTKHIRVTDNQEITLHHLFFNFVA